jgi:thiamine-phosphate pyrophosphorylase
MQLVLPRLYVILAAALLTHPEIEMARSLAQAGVRLLQYRNKQASARELFEKSRELAEELLHRQITFIVNDRADVAALVGASGVHVGQDDLSVAAARSIVGPSSMVGISTHNLEQFAGAAATSADYIALGPIFETASKVNPDPVVGLEMIRAARRLTDEPIVAIGGITLERAADVIAAGADSVAVSSDILRAADPAQRARQFIDLLGSANHAAAV